MARTYGSHAGPGCAGKYPARCDLCGVVYFAEDLRRGPDGFFRCPDDQEERGALELDRANASYRSPGIVDSRGPHDPPVADISVEVVE